jgi:hypothetical protein
MTRLEHKNSKLLLNIAISRFREFDEYNSAYIAEEFFVLLRNVFEEQAGSHIEEVIAKLTPTRPFRGFNV